MLAPRLRAVGVHSSGRVTSSIFHALLLLSTVVLSGSAGAQNPASPAAAQPASAAAVKARQKLSQLAVMPLAFEPNQGQLDERGLFFARAGNAQVLLERSGFSVALEGSSAEGKTKADVVRMTLTGAAEAPSVTGAERLPGTVSYFLGNDSRNWHAHIPTYGKVRYEEIYPGISLLYYGNQSRLENDFVLAPGADPQRIRMRFTGVKALQVDGEGNLLVQGASGSMRLQKPLVYQEEDGRRREVRAQYVLASSDTVTIRLAAYDRRKQVVIDPVIDFLTYLTATTSAQQGLPAAVSANAIAVDASGNVYIAGSTPGMAFPGAVASYTSPQLGTTLNAYMAKLAPDGSTPLFTAFIGGSSTQSATGVAVDASGNAYVTGWTNPEGAGISSGFPTTSTAYQQGPTANATATTQNAFLTVLNPGGKNPLVYSTLLGGSGVDGASGVAVTAAANGIPQVFLTGSTNSIHNVSSDGFPVTANAYQSTLSGVQDAFVSQFDIESFGIQTAACGTGGTQTVVTVTALNGSVLGIVPGEIVIVSGVQGNTVFNGQFAVTSVNTSNGTFTYTQPSCTGNPGVGGTVTGGLVYSTFLGCSGSADCSGTSGASTGVSSASCTSGKATLAVASTSGFNTNDRVDVSGVANGTDSGKTVVFNGQFALSAIDTTHNTVSYALACTSVASYTTSGTVRLIPASVYGSAIHATSPQSVVVAGVTSTSGFPVTSDAVQGSFGGGSSDAFLAKFDPTATPGSKTLFYSSYLGGAGADAAASVAVDGSGNSYLTGYTQSTNFPTAGTPYQTGLGNGAKQNAFVSEIGPSVNNASTLVYSTYLGGGGPDQGTAIGVDATGVAYVAGWTQSGPNFFHTNAADGTLQGTQDGFVAALNPAGQTGSQLLFGTYLGGAGNADQVTGLALCPGGGAGCSVGSGSGATANGGTTVFVAGNTDAAGWVYPGTGTNMATATAYQPYGASISAQQQGGFAAKLTTLPVATALTLTAAVPTPDPCVGSVSPNIVGYETKNLGTCGNGPDFGTTITYNYTIDSPGTPATDVVFNWPTPANGGVPKFSVGTVTLTPQGAGTCTVSGQEFGVVCSLPTLAADTPVTVSIPATALAGAQCTSGCPVPISNVATLAAGDAPLVTAATSVNSVPLADVRISSATLTPDKSTDGTFKVDYDTTVQYAVTFTNYGPGAATDVQATFQLPDKTAPTGCTGPSSYDSQTNTYTYVCGTVSLAAPNPNPNSATLTVTSTPPPLDPLTSSVTLTYEAVSPTTATGGYIQFPLENTPVTSTITQERSATLALDVTQDLPNPVDLDNLQSFPSVVTYTATVSNCTQATIASGPTGKSKQQTRQRNGTKSGSNSCGASTSFSHATDVVVTMQIPQAPTAFTVTSSTATCQNGSCSQTFPDLAPGSAGVFTVTGVYPNATDLLNQASAVVASPVSATAAIVDVIPATALNTTVQRRTDLGITSLSNSTTTANPGVLSQPITVSTTLGNAGPNDGTNVVVTFTFPAASGTGTAYTYSSDTFPQKCSVKQQSGPVIYTCTVGGLAVGANPTYTLSVIPGNGALPDTTAQGTATVSAAITSKTVVDGGNGPKTATDPGINLARQADLTATGLGSSPNPSSLAGPLALPVTVQDAGPDDATNVIVTYTFANISGAGYSYSSDNYPQHCTETSTAPVTYVCKVGMLTKAQGATLFTLSVIPGQAALSASTSAATISVTARVSSTAGVIDINPGNETSTDSNVGIQRQVDLAATGPGLGLSSSPNPSSLAGPMALPAAVQNMGPDDATNVVVTYTFNNISGTGYTYSSDTYPQHCTETSTAPVTYVCTVGALTKAQGVTKYTLSVVPGQAALPANTDTGTISVTAQISSTAGVVDSKTGNETSTDSNVGIQRQADLAATGLTSSPNPSSLAGQLALAATVKDLGPDDATNVTVTYTFSNITGSVYTYSGDNYPGQCTATSNAPVTYVCKVGTLTLAQGAVTYTLTVVPGQNALPANQGSAKISVTALVAATGSAKDNNSANNAVTDSNIGVQRQGDLAIVNWTNTAQNPQPLSTSFDLSATVANANGPDDATNVTVTYVFTGANGAVYTYGGDTYPQHCLKTSTTPVTYVCSVGPLPAGTKAAGPYGLVVTPGAGALGNLTQTQVQNLTATVGSTSVVNSNSANNIVNDSVTVGRVANVALTMTNSQSGNPSLNGAIPFTTTITNQGPDDVPSVVVTFTPSPTPPTGTYQGVSLPSGCTQSGTSISCTVNVPKNLNQPTTLSFGVIPGTAALAACTASAPLQYTASAPAGSWVGSAQTSVNSFTLERQPRLTTAITANSPVGVTNPATQGAGNDPAYKVTITNAANTTATPTDPATCVNLNLTLPSEFVVSQLPTGCSGANPITCNNLTVAAGPSATTLTIGPFSGYFDVTGNLNVNGTWTQNSSSVLAGNGVSNTYSANNSVTAVNTSINAPSVPVEPPPPSLPYVSSLSYAKVTSPGITTLSAGTVGFGLPSGYTTYHSFPTLSTNPPTVYYTAATPAPAPTYAGAVNLCVNYTGVLFDVGKEQRAQLLLGSNPVTSSLNTASKQICGQTPSVSPAVQLAVFEPVNHAPTLSSGLAPSATQSNIQGVLVPNLVQISADFNRTPDPDNSAPYNGCYSGTQATTCTDTVYHLWVGQISPLVSRITTCANVTSNFVVVTPGTGNPCSNYATSADPLHGIQANVPTGNSNLYFYAMDQVGLSVLQNYVATHPGNLPADGTAAAVMCAWAGLSYFPSSNPTSSECGISVVNQVPATAISYSLGQTATEATVYPGQSASFQVSTNQSYTVKSPYYSYITCSVSPSAGTGIGCVASPAVLTQAGARSAVLISTVGTTVGSLSPRGPGRGIPRGLLAFGMAGMMAFVMVPRRFRMHRKVTGLLCVIVLGCGTMLSCGGGGASTGGSSSNVGTPPGDYTITATATLMQAVGSGGTPNPATDPAVPYVSPQSITFTLHVK